MSSFTSMAKTVFVVAAICGGAAAVASPAAAEPGAVSVAAVSLLSPRIENAVVTAVAGSPLNSGSLAAATNAVQQVIILSGADSGTVLAALAQAKMHLAALGNRDATLALNMVSAQIEATLIATAAPTRPGHRRPPPPPPPPPPSPGHSGYHRRVPT